jgi:hypothetical protein
MLHMKTSYPSFPNFLCLDGPLNGRYVTLAEGYAAGYSAPDAALAALWSFEPVLVA